ncbi:phospholipid methyltransferase [Paenibacillaceae bacterium]|nr:phospholipid methyltransferase [Paenibacillaceae bacterium]
MIKSTFHDKLLFLYKYFRYPKQIGSVTPSSKFLALEMATGINWHQTRSIAELGAGTGTVTQWISALNITRAEVILFEKDGDLRSHLQCQNPDTPIYPDALQIRDALRRTGIAQLDAVISGLPFYNFDQNTREHLLEEISSALKPGGQFIAFQYSLQMKKTLQQRFTLDKISFVPWNFPPAFVYFCRNK